MKKLIEIRSLSIKPGSRSEFHRRYLEKTLPLLLKWKMDVVAFGPSLHDENTFYVIRAFDSLEHRQKSEDDYYGSADWREGPREEMVSLIESYIDIVLEMEEATVNALRKNVNLHNSRLAAWEKKVLSKHGFNQITLADIPKYLAAFWKRRRNTIGKKKW